VALECRQPIVPRCLHLLEPTSDGAKWLGPQAEHTLSGIGGSALIFDQPALGEDPKVAAHHRRRGADGPGKCSGGSGPGVQQLDDLASRRVGQGA